MKGRTVAFVCVWELQHVCCLCFTRRQSHYMTKCDSYSRQKKEKKGFVARADNLAEKKNQVKRS